MDKEKPNKPIEPTSEVKQEPSRLPGMFTPRIVSMLADEIVKTVATRLPALVTPAPTTTKAKAKKSKKIEHAMFLDTSAIIDSRIFDVVKIGLLNGVFVIPESILLELKHIADSQITVRRERGRKGLELLEKMKKFKDVKMIVLTKDEKINTKVKEVDEELILLAKEHKGKIITCDYNLEKKANIQGVTAINVNAVANALKVIAVPGDAVHIKVLHPGKDTTQGVGYLDDGTMIVVEEGSALIGKNIDVVVARVIQTATGRILFAKKI